MPPDNHPPSSLETMTKHEQLIRHIEALEPGTRISVRGIARELDVSEGTAYKAIKEAEELGVVATKKGSAPSACTAPGGARSKD